MWKELVTIIAVLQIASGLQGGIKSFQVLAQWRDLVFQFPSPRHESEARSNGNYVPGNAVPIDVDIDYRVEAVQSRVFVTMPRFTTGIPFTLATVRHGTQNEPKVVPYPSYEWHSSHGRDCNGLTSVFRVAIDECRRLWVSDTGMIDSTQHCAPSLAVFDLNSDQLIHRYVYPKTQYKDGVSLFITPIVDVRDPVPKGRCANTMVYTADVTGFGLLVYDFLNNRSWRVENKLMYPVPRYGTFTIAGESFDLMDGMFAISLTPKHRLAVNGNLGYGYLNPQANGRPKPRKLFFHAMASITENAVPLDLIDNATIWLANPGAMANAFKVLGNRPTQSAAEAMDSNGNMFFGLMDPISMACWNIDTPFSSANINIVARNNATLQFASGVKVIRNSNNEEELWVNTCRFQKIMAGTKSANEINFRIQGARVRDLLNGHRSCASLLRNRDNLVSK